MLSKLLQVYGIGCKHFSLLLDDISKVLSEDQKALFQSEKFEAKNDKEAAMNEAKLLVSAHIYLSNQLIQLASGNA